MRNKCLLGLGLVFVISLTSMVAFAFSFTGTPADEVDETEIIVSAVVSKEADAMPTTEPITTTGQEMVKNEQSKIGSMDWDSDDAYRLAKIAMAEAESEDTEGKMERGIKLSGVKKITVHCTRHSHASMLVQMGFSPVEIAKRLGHRKVTTTIETYCHQSMDAQVKIVDRLGKVERGEESGV